MEDYVCPTRNSHRIKLQFIVAQKMSFNIEPKDIAYSMTD